MFHHVMSFHDEVTHAVRALLQHNSFGKKKPHLATPSDQRAETFGGARWSHQL